jgi:hypothetical protein
MNTPPKLASPRVRVTRDGHEDLELQTTNIDLVLWDRTRWKHKWPSLEEAPFLMLTFVAWAAARRTGAIPPDLKYEVWESTVLAVTAVTDEEEDEEEVGTPTQPGPAPD